MPRYGFFPVGAWGNPQPDDDRKVPRGDVIRAAEGVLFEARASLQGTLPAPIVYHQVESGPRKPLPFLNEAESRGEFLRLARRVSDVLPAANDDAATYAAATPWLAAGGMGATAIAALRADRSGPPRLGSLTEGLASRPPRSPRVRTTRPSEPSAPDFTVAPPRLIAVLASPIRPETIAIRTTVADTADVPRVAPPDPRAIDARAASMAAKLVTTGSAASTDDVTLVARRAVPFTRTARGSAAAVRARGAPTDGRGRDSVRVGDISVLELPNASRDVDDEAPRPRLDLRGVPTRVVALGAGGRVMFDKPDAGRTVEVPQGTERLVILPHGAPPGDTGGLAGWHSGQELAYIGWSSALAPGALVSSDAARITKTRQRFRAGWVQAPELVDGSSIVTTRFVDPVTSVVVMLDDPVGAEGGRGLALALQGAARRSNGGEPLPPTAVVAANRTFLVYAIELDGSEAVAVSVASEDGWHLAGVLGAVLPVAALVDRITRYGIDDLLQPLVPGRGGSVDVKWTAPRRRRERRPRLERTS